MLPGQPRPGHMNPACCCCPLMLALLLLLLAYLSLLLLLFPAGSNLALLDPASNTITGEHAAGQPGFPSPAAADRSAPVSCRPADTIYCLWALGSAGGERCMFRAASCPAVT